MHYDLIIVGGGLVGAGLACALQDAGLSIALLDAKKANHPDPRLFALSKPTCQLLSNIGIWNEVVEHAAPIKSIRISYAKRFGTLRLTAEDIGLKELGNVLPAFYLERALDEKLKSLKNISLYKPAKLTHINIDEDDAVLLTKIGDDEKRLTASVVIAADGSTSCIRQQLEIATDEVDYNQTAIVTRTLLSGHHGNIAYERFTADGALAMLPLMGNECATIWTLPNQKARSLTACSDLEFLKNLQAAFGLRLGKFQKIAARFSFPLHMVRVKNSAYKNVFFMGNAAHTLHPLAAQGFNLAMYEVAVLAELLNVKTMQRDKISLLDLQEAVTKMDKQQRTSINFSHGLAQMFAKHSSIFSVMLPIGFAGLTVIPLLKRNLLQRLLGMHNAMPNLLRAPE